MFVCWDNRKYQGKTKAKRKSGSHFYKNGKWEIPTSGSLANASITSSRTDSFELRLKLASKSAIMPWMMLKRLLLSMISKEEIHHAYDSKFFSMSSEWFKLAFIFLTGFLFVKLASEAAIIPWQRFRGSFSSCFFFSEKTTLFSLRIIWKRKEIFSVYGAYLWGNCEGSLLFRDLKNI